MQEYITMKKFHSRQDVVDSYNFPNDRVDDIGSLWFMTPLQVQLKNFVNGLGRIMYFKTIHRDLETTPYVEELEDCENRIPVMYEMIIDYVLFIDSTHNVNCDCENCGSGNKSKLLKVDGFDDCYLGVGESFGDHPALIYDYEKIIQQLKQDGMSEEEAIEYYEFNILGSYIGEKMPIFLNRVPLDELGFS